MIAPHPHERPLRATVILVSALFWAGLALLLWTLWERYVFALSGIDVALLAGAGAIVAYVGMWLRKAGRAAALMGHAVEIGSEQFPDLHARVRTCTKRLGFAETPLAYLFQHPGNVVSFGLRYWARDYIALSGELIGALTEHQGAIDFFIGYELGRLHDPDRGLRVLLSPGRVLPLLGPAYARAKIYTYDRYGIAACRARVDAALALALVACRSRRWKSINIGHYAEQSLREDIGFTFFELASSTPYLSRRAAHLRGVATGAGATTRRHPLAWIGAALVPGIGPRDAGVWIRAAVAILWPAVFAVALWHGYQQLARAGLVDPIESRFENKIVPLTSPPATAPANSPGSTAVITPVPAPQTPAVAVDAYARLDADLRKLGEVALNRFRKLGGVPCEVGNIAALDLNFRASRYAFSCDEPLVYTVVEFGEFETGRAAHLRSYLWKEQRFTTSLPPAPVSESAGDRGASKPAATTP